MALGNVLAIIGVLYGLHTLHGPWLAGVCAGYLVGVMAALGALWRRRRSLSPPAPISPVRAPQTRALLLQIRDRATAPPAFPQTRLARIAGLAQEALAIEDLPVDELLTTLLAGVVKAVLHFPM